MKSNFLPGPCTSCAEESLPLLLIETFPILLSSGDPSSSWIAWHKKGAMSICWKQIIKCINCVSTSLPSHLAYCQGPIRFPWFYVPKIICSVVNGTRIFAVWLKKNHLIFFQILVRLKFHLWAAMSLENFTTERSIALLICFFLFLQWFQQSQQHWCGFVYQWWGTTRYWNAVFSLFAKTSSF